MKTILTVLEQVTHVIGYSPNCPMRYLVRLVGKNQGIIDKKSRPETKDILGYGKTLETAARKALMQKYSKETKKVLEAERAAREFFNV